MYKPTIGLEVHVELNTASKMFCACRNKAEEKQPNFNVCPICLGHPGTLPVINKEALEKVIKAGLALGGDISWQSYFDRKNYFYPDLPKGYQISQHSAPFCRGGHLMVEEKDVRLREIHLEEDTCKLYHSSDAKSSLVDCNRSGIPLMELVTEPDLKSAKEAKKFAEELQLILRYLDVSDANMEKGQMRIEANVSLSEEEGRLGEKVELKNINSFRAVEKAIEHEIERQRKLLEKGEKILPQTRGWSEAKGATVLQREKETAFDYRYFPEPDLPLLQFGEDYLKKIKLEIPELPQEKRERLAKEYHLGESESGSLVQNEELGNYFEKVISELPSRLRPEELKEMTRLAFNYLTTDLVGLLAALSLEKKTSLTIGPDLLITPENFAELVAMVSKKEISSKTAKDILKEMFETGADPSQIVETKNLAQTGNETEIESIAKKVISENQKAVFDYKAGKKNAFQFLLGQIMAQSRGKANPEIAEKILRKILS